ncbi:unnamed protein product [Paramecium pentaurelia]|uniref:Tetratricopeptide repeat protein n=1 Tax=Paramecium pentaurelia TaxID=43138 RepID=A0A8S1W0F0_9CILI|nr:unnamed protein product [Paramecium pentaurelia]
MSNNSLKENENADALAHYSRSQEFKITYQIEEALLEINNALNLCPQFAEAYTFRSELYENLKLYDKALEDVNYSISINNMNAKSYYQRATIYWRKKIFDLALQDCMKCVQINPNFAIGYNRIGTIMGDLKQKDSELSYYNQAIEKDENCYYAFMCREIQVKLYILILNIVWLILIEVNTIKFNIIGYLYCKIGEKDKALNDYNNAIQLDPNDASAYIKRGELQYTEYNRHYIQGYWLKKQSIK